MVKYFLMGLFVLNFYGAIVCSISHLLMDAVPVSTLEEYDRQCALKAFRSYQEDQHSRIREVFDFSDEVVRNMTPDEYFDYQAQILVQMTGKTVDLRELERISRERFIR